MGNNFSNIIDEETQETVTEVSKSQNVRLADVFILAPIMIYVGTFKALPMWLRVSMIGMGVATAVYNGKNFIENRSNLQKSNKSKKSEEI
jgi:hypothetical protein